MSSLQPRCLFSVIVLLVSSASAQVTSVGLSAPASDFSVTGSPVTQTGTLTLNWNVAPDTNNTPNAIVKRDAMGNIFGNVIIGDATNPQGAAILANNFDTTTASDGISGSTSSSVFGSAGVRGDSSPAIGAPGWGVLGTTNSTITSPGSGVIGIAGATTGSAQGVQGFTYSPNGVGVYGADISASGTGATSFNFGQGAGVWGDSGNSTSIAVLGTADSGQGGFFENNSGVTTLGVENNGGGDVFGAQGNSGWCRIDSTGNLFCSGSINAAGKNFRIDHPLDPAGKYLVHASVESSEMKNIYDGVVTTDARGNATVHLPTWFESLNGDFRYQLTVIGQFAQAIVAREIQNHEFAIKTNLPNVKVSWQVTGVRHDAWAQAHPLVVEEQKQQNARGFFIHPELYRAPKERGVEYALHPETMQRLIARRTPPATPRKFLVPPRTLPPSRMHPNVRPLAPTPLNQENSGPNSAK